MPTSALREGEEQDRNADGSKSGSSRKPFDHEDAIRYGRTGTLLLSGIASAREVPVYELSGIAFALHSSTL